MIDVLFDEESINKKFNIRLAERPVVPVAEMEYESIEVPGRHGSLTRKIGYRSKPFSLKFNYIDINGAKPKYRDIVNWLTNKRKIHFSDDKDYYRVIQQMNPVDAENDIREYADFVVEMITEPFWYKDHGIQLITQKTTLQNPSVIETSLKLTVYGDGICRVRVNDNQMVFTDVQGHITIDRGTAHRNGINQDNKMSGHYPIFLPGNNEIEIGGSTRKVDIEVRWCWR
ncbi:distal tail protein Dit [Marinilactibacillus sp. GCM10026970]|uniref:distal tail protein Dit n=1 Tax=Marinilactibacillus sp. GCM10026970 TaxID=3252642 RepID=UPI00360C4FD5